MLDNYFKMFNQSWQSNLGIEDERLTVVIWLDFIMMKNYYWLSAMMKNMSFETEIPERPVWNNIW